MESECVACRFKQLGSTVERVGKTNLGWIRRPAFRSVLDDESPADGKERPLHEDRAAGIERSESHAVGVSRMCIGGKHLVAVENHVASLVEFEPSLPRKLYVPGSANRSHCGFNCGGIDGGRLVSGETQENRAIGSMAQARQREGAIQVYLQTRNSVERPADSRSRTNRQAARIGPMVCELEGPTPTLYRSKRLAVTHQIVAGKAGTGSRGFQVSRQRTSLFEKLADRGIVAVEEFME